MRKDSLLGEIGLKFVKQFIFMRIQQFIKIT